MFPGRLLPLLVAALIINLAMAVSAQAPPVTASDSASDPHVLTNQFVLQIVSTKLPEEISAAKIQTSKTKFDLPTPARVELNRNGESQNVVKAMITPKNAPPRVSHNSMGKERT